MMQQIIEKQNKSLEKLVELSKQDRLLQLIQTKETVNIDEDGDKTVEALEKIDKSINDMSKKMNDKGKDGVSSNVVKLKDELKKSAEKTKQLFQTAAISTDQAKDSVKDFFTMRGFLDKTGIVQRGTGGILSDTLDRREERQKYVESRLKMDPTARLHGEEKSKQIFSRQFDEQQNVQRNIRQNESKISSFKKLGFTEEQIRRSEEFKKRETLATDLAKVDTRVRPQGFDAKTGLIKTKIQPPETVTEQTKKSKKSVIAADTDTVTRSVKPETVAEQKPVTEQTQVRSKPVLVAKPETVTEQTKKSKKSVIAADTDTTTRTTKPKPQKVSEQQATAGAEASSSILSAVSNVIPFPGKAAGGEKSNPTVISALNAEEGTLEQSRKLDDQTELLKQIEENTRGAGGTGKGSAKEEPKTDGGSGILDSIIGFLGSGITSAFKFLFNPKNLLKVFTRFLAPAMLIGSLVNGIMDGFKAFAETGSIGEALIAGLGGVLSFLTFGLFDADTIRNVVDAVSGFVNDYIVEPVKNFVNFIGESFNTYVKEPIMAAFDTVAGLFDEYIVQPLKTIFEPVTSFFKSLKDTVFGWFENFEIPGISFNVFGKEMGFGPWRPFKSETAETSAIPAGNSNAGAGQGSSEFAATDPRRVDTAAANVVTAPPQNAPAGIQNNGDGTAKPPQRVSKIAGETWSPGSNLSPKQLAVIEQGIAGGTTYSFRVIEQYDKQKGNARAPVTSSVRDTPIPAASPQSGNAVAKQSEQNREANMDANKPSAAGGNTIVSAPTVNNVQHSQQTIKLPTRNQDNSLSHHLSKRYA